ncbi:MAG: 4Fe-4S binding protein [Candidatus Omnitrophota bacterium]
MSYRITESCIQCECCAEACPKGAIDRDENNNFVILNDCDGCGECVKVCPVGAIAWEDRL